MRRANKAPGSCFATTPRHKGAASTGHRPSTETGGQRVRTDTSHPSSKALQPLKQTAPLRGWNRCDAVLRTRDVHKSSEAIPSRQRPGRIMTPEVRHLHVDVISSHIIYHFYGYMKTYIWASTSSHILIAHNLLQLLDTWNPDKPPARRVSYPILS